MDTTVRKVLIRDNVPIATYAVLIFGGMFLDTFRGTNWCAFLGIVLAIASLWAWNSRLDRWWPRESYQEAKTRDASMVTLRAATYFAWGVVVAVFWTGLCALDRHLDGQGSWSDCWSWQWFFAVLGVVAVVAAVSWLWGMLSIRLRTRREASRA